MVAKAAQYRIQGMNRDLSESNANIDKLESPFKWAYEIMNMRVVPISEDNTEFSLVNEKGTELIAGLSGIVIGKDIVGDNLVLFVKDVKDKICRVYYNDNNELQIDTLFSGNLNFNLEYPIETTTYYENEKIQKVYWTDGLNQPRVINICNVQYSDDTNPFGNCQFDFVPYVALNETVTISKMIGGGGLFPAGTIQYVFTYSNQYMQETNIFYQSDLYYTSYADRGADPEETISNSFKIELQNIDSNYKYLNVYSIMRTSLNSTPIVKHLTPVAIGENTSVITIIDDGTEGSSVDPTELFYIGGKDIIAQTIEQKDNTLFLGNIENLDKRISELIKSFIDPTNPNNITYFQKSPIDKPPATGIYPFTNSLNSKSSDYKTLKYLEWYRFGLQFQYKTGEWSEAIWVGDKRNTIPVVDNWNSNNQISLVGAKFSLHYSISQTLINAGFVKVRPVIVYPDINERECLCQGVVCPTVFNLADRAEGRFYSLSSWFTRAYNSALGGSYQNLQQEVNGHLDYIPSTKSSESRGEIVCNLSSIYRDAYDTQHTPTEYDYYPVFVQETNYESNKERVLNNKNGVFTANTFGVDKSICTVHSPDIEFNPELKLLDFANIKFRLIGVVPITSGSIDINVLGNTTPYAITNFDAEEFTPVSMEEGNYGYPKGFVHYMWQMPNKSYYGGYTLLQCGCWQDDCEYNNVSENQRIIGNPDKYTTVFNIYPWHSDILNNGNGDGSRTSTLKNKTISHLRYCHGTCYMQSNKVFNLPISDSKIWNFDQQSPIKLNMPHNITSDYTLTYLGTVDKILACNANFLVNYYDGSNNYYNATGYPIPVSDRNRDVYSSMLFNHKFLDWFWDSADRLDHDITQGYTPFFRSNLVSSRNPIAMRYKSTAHAVISLDSVYNQDTNKWYWSYLPDFNGDEWKWYTKSRGVTGDVFIWNKHLEGYVSHTQYLNNLFYSGADGWRNYRLLWLGEFYRDDITPQTRFGGTSDEALENNTWIPCGEPLLLDENNTIDVLYTSGDTYYQRYDHLKTYPYSKEETNNLVEIISFMCETRVNIDGRYDRNRGLSSNLHITPVNFNLLNDGYSQKNNFFNYRTINQNKIILSKFSNQITWTKSKVAGELIDTWCNVTLASFLDMDGNKGSVRSLNRFRNELLCFQDKGLARIKYNENAALQVQNGLPVELANSGKVDGKDYISESVGTKNKWAIESTPAGLFFVDGYNKSLYRYEPTQSSIPVDIANAMGFITYFRNSNVNEIWDPKNNKGYRLNYDNINGDLFITDKDNCLAFNTRLNCFSSFYSYLGNPWFVNFNDKGIFIERNLSEEESHLWEEHGNSLYNLIFGNTTDFYVDIITNPSPHTDKIFDNLEFREDCFDYSNDVYIPNITMSHIRAYNEYQDTEEAPLNLYGSVNNYGEDRNIPSNLKKKFRMWRVNIPRDKKDKNHLRNRIRNPWTHIKLSNKESTYHKHMLNDMIVYYFE